MTALFRRRAFAAFALAMSFVSPALADWREQYPELYLGISSSENENDAIARNQGYAAYLTEKLGVPVNVVRGTDYAAVIEAMRAGNVHFASIGPANYALAHRVMGEDVAPVAVSLDLEGNRGYYSVLAVRADSPYQSLEDVAGKPFAFADPNSASGFAIPSYYLRETLGMPPEEYFGEVAFSGGHEQSVIALLNGTFEVVATHWTNETRGNIQRMVEKGMIEEGSTRIIWTSPLIPSSPVVMRTDLPQEVQDLFKEALFAFPDEAPDAFNELHSNQSSGYGVATHEDYIDMVAITEYNAEQRRLRGN
ncbi:phosphonate ABC transporter substrate-binding protein [Pelagibacterium limicola]|uniref:phosphonate ABC transporter substrate-binding protein n=1 Tax=Pelagibacterium limicola TaxID=2791022 RepID=UPI0018AFC220|nr:phosphonate ABC transporter substrate-binding protein [Pelagibacterium limicola]